MREPTTEAVIAGGPVSPGTRLRRVTGWCGIGMMAAILINDPLSAAVQRVPSYWSPGASPRLTTYLQD